MAATKTFKLTYNGQPEKIYEMPDEPEFTETFEFAKQTAAAAKITGEVVKEWKLLYGAASHFLAAGLTPEQIDKMLGENINHFARAAWRQPQYLMLLRATCGVTATGAPTIDTDKAVLGYFAGVAAQSTVEKRTDPDTKQLRLTELGLDRHILLTIALFREKIASGLITFDHLLRLLEYYWTYDFSTLYTTQNDEMRLRIRNLQEARKFVMDRLMLDISDPIINDTYRPIVSGKMHSCEGRLAPGVTIPAVGDHTLRTRDEVLAHINRLTDGVNPMNPRWPKGLLIAGGIGKTARRAVDLAQPASPLASADAVSPKDSPVVDNTDVDCYLVGPADVAIASVHELIQWLTEVYGHVWISVLNGGGVITISPLNAKRNWQIIATSGSTPVEIVSMFDVGHVQQFLGRNEAGEMTLFMSPLCLKAIVTGVTDMAAVYNFKPTRVIKALSHGFNVREHEITKNSKELQEIIADGVKYKATLDEMLYGVFHPQCAGTPTEADIGRITSALKKQPYVVKVLYNDIPSALAELQITPGNFRKHGGYGGFTVAVTSITAETVTIPKNDHNGPLKRLRGGNCGVRIRNAELVSVASNPEGDVIITMKVDDNFKTLAARLDDVAAKMGPDPLSQSILAADGTVKMKIEKTRIDQLSTTGMTAVHTMHMQPIAMADIIGGDVKGKICSGEAIPYLHSERGGKKYFTLVCQQLRIKVDNYIRPDVVVNDVAPKIAVEKAAVNTDAATAAQYVDLGL